MAIETFDDFRSTEFAEQGTNQKPFQFRDDPNDDEKTLKWLTTNFDTMTRMAES